MIWTPERENNFPAGAAQEHRQSSAECASAENGYIRHRRVTDSAVAMKALVNPQSIR
jgi:hypothetical protein